MTKFNKHRCDSLYTFLLLQGDQWVQQEQVCGIYGVDGGVFHNSSERRELSQDIQNINESPDYKKIIISGSRGIKIATEREAEAYLSALKNSLTQRWKRYWLLAKKVGENRQIDFEGNVTEAFLEGN